MPSPKDIYLILYNSFCCAGWASVLVGALKVVVASSSDDSILDSLAQVYEPVATMLMYSQSAALMEIVHSMVGLVRSPVIVTAMQVGSRIVALVAIMYSAQAQCE